MPDCVRLFHSSTLGAASVQHVTDWCPLVEELKAYTILRVVDEMTLVHQDAGLARKLAMRQKMERKKEQEKVGKGEETTEDMADV
ncbi:uncharacterized protein BKCO1_7000131 [Diplodia corticola]|uniref:Uncharacterized protein n=1 Tax=Diplodia corticola TaxID=236234 RepID=A0A1J9SA54_9PEZI|nr:uncharacterized protein BKCO1_7000131 [Diplodia corticola]OJD37367.1 hypothetical protein BKCO1_7000131 [Diplodia corticola]